MCNCKCTRSVVGTSAGILCLLVLASLATTSCSQQSTPKSTAEAPRQVEVPQEADAPQQADAPPQADATAEPAMLPVEPTASREIELVRAEVPANAKPAATKATAAKPTATKSPVKQPEAGRTSPPAEKPAAPAALPSAKASLPLAEANAGETTMPVVTLSTAHAGISQIKVGDQFPNLELADLSGAAQKLSSLRGQKLTVVVFWKSAHPTSVEELADLERDTLKRFGQNGVAVVAINSGDPATVAADLAKQAQVTYPVLLDADGTALQRVATQKLPRTYLLNVQGKVVWFDLEYSATTRRDLSQAIRYSLAH